MVSALGFSDMLSLAQTVGIVGTMVLTRNSRNSFSTELVTGTKRPVWLTIPAVIVLSRPYGLPTAITGCPILSLDEFPIINGPGSGGIFCCHVVS
jgi:hypothetical protein